MADEEIGARLSLKDRRKFSDDANRAAKDIKDIGDQADKADKAGRRMGSGLGVAKSGIGGLVSVAKLGVTAVAGLTVGVAALGAKTVGMAMDAGETESKFHTVFKGMEADVESFVTRMNTDFGIPKQELQDAASTFGVFGKAAGVADSDLAKFSTDLVSAGTDMASFYNAPVDEVFLALRSGLSGESEPLRKFGIFLSDAALNAYALEKGIGKTTTEMSEQEKVALRQRYILDSMGDAQGDLARTSDSLSNKWKALQGRMKDAGTAIGVAFLPYAEKLANVLDDKLGPIVAEMTRTAPMVGDAFRGAFANGDITTEAWSLVGIAERLGVAAEVATYYWGKFSDAFKGGGLRGVVTEFESMVNTGGILTDTFDAIAGIVDHAGVIFRDLILPVLNDVNEVIPRGIRPLEILEEVLGFVADNAKTLRPILVGLVAGMVAYRAANVAANGVLAIQTALQKANTTTLKAHIVQSKIAKAATAVWTGAQWLLNAALSANPIALVVIGIAALVAAFVLAWNHSETFREIVTGAFEKVKSIAMGAFNWVKENWPLLLGILTGPIGLAVLAIVENWETIKNAFTGAKDWIAEKAVGMWDGIKTAFKSALNFIIDGWNALEFKIPGFKVGPIGYDGFTLGVPDIPRLHTGGRTTSGGAAIIQPDEEAVVLPPAASVVPITQQERFDFGRGGDGGWPERVVLEVDGKVLAEVLRGQVRDEVARK